ncbi:hypothetical protein LCGC14_2019890 [marine sediment metagenome]|uniref:Head-tail adaptor protein n=1 Tax=marine sediment metagenome TaxID=412755 RepID=A0A0F9FKD1_9ZZZZ
MPTIPVNMLTDRCTIQRWTKASAGSDGKGIWSFVELATNVPCKQYGYNRGTERFSNRQGAVDLPQFDFRPSQDITEKDRIVWESRDYNVTSILRVTARGVTHHFQVFVTIVEDNA